MSSVRWERMVLLLSWEGDCCLRTVACLIVCLCVCWKLPVPVAVTALMYSQRLLPCFSHSPRLLDRNSQSQTSNTADGSHGKACTIVCVCLIVFTLTYWNDRPLGLPLWSGIGSLFVCCNPAKLRGSPATFFILHALAGAVLFITDGIIVRFLLSLPMYTSY